MEANDTTMDRLGECEGREGPMICTMEVDPQCGVDGRTYRNKCLIRGSGVQILHSGECKFRDC